MSMERKTQKVLDMTVDGLHIYCVKHLQDDANPYRLYCKWYYYNGDRDYGYHTKQVAKYANFISLIDHIRNFMYNHHNGFSEGA